MGQFDGLVRRLNTLTGKTARRNRKLRVVSEWVDTISHFLQTYGLQDEIQLEKLLDQPGNAKFDLVGITHNGRPLASEAGELKGTGIQELVAGIVERADAIRRYLIKPDLQEEHLVKTLGEFQEHYEKLQAAIDAYDAG